MNPELIRIANENRAIVDSLIAEIENKKLMTATAHNKSIKSGGLWKIVFVVGIAIIGYNFYSYYNNKKQLDDL
jgi:hypothetical protein